MKLLFETTHADGFPRRFSSSAESSMAASDRAISILRGNQTIESVGVFDPTRSFSTVAYWTRADLLTITAAAQNGAK